jgi:hypothetical protein
MKTTIRLALASLLLAAAACGRVETTDEYEPSAPVEETEQVPEEVPEATPEATPEPTPTPNEAPPTRR